MPRSNTVQADYLVATVPINSVDEQRLDDFAKMTFEGKLKKFYGYRGFMLDNLYIGDNGDRMMLMASGAKAQEAVKLIDTKWPGLSVARLDIQLTIYVADADSLIRGIMPAPAYKSVRLTNLSERGSTLYVGSPKSRCRLRVYNKTAQLAEDRVQDMEKLRIELQLRDDYADRGLVNLLAGAGDMFFRFYVQKMTDAYIANLLDRAFKDSNMVAMVKEELGNKEDSRKTWLENCVLPAIMRLAVSDREYYEQFVQRLRDLID
jgi:hypothetical protein